MACMQALDLFLRRRQGSADPDEPILGLQLRDTDIVPCLLQ